MTDPAIASPQPERSNPVRDGDALARQSQWQSAVARWLEGHASDAPELRSAADQRLHWLIAEAESSRGKRDREESRRDDAYRMFLLALLAGSAATVLIVLGMQTAAGTSPLLAVGGWLGIVASMFFAIAYTLRLHDADHPVGNSPVTDELIAEARRIAARLDHQGEAAFQRTGDERDAYE